MTIGLFGGWGTGKSSIVENLRNELLQTKVPVIIFDVWKHDGDALRRTFLHVLDQQLSTDPYGKSYVKETCKLDTRVFSAKTISTEKVIFKGKKLVYHLASLLIISTAFALPLIVFAILAYWLFNIPLFTSLKASSILSSLGGVILSVFSGGLAYKYIDSFVNVEKDEEKKEKFQDPYEFETEFRNLVDNLLPEISTLVVVFDNLDRIPGEHALLVISTIKTFLDFKSADESRKVIFLIPCDEQAIKNQISMTIQTNDIAYIDEFLRKFFNTNIWIPDFYENELEAFATEKLLETGVDDFSNPWLAWLIIRAFNQNPRQIVQFINILLSNYLLLKSFCESKDINDPLFYRKNLPQLARFLILKFRYPEIIAYYRQENIYELEAEEALRVILRNEGPFPDGKDFRAMVHVTREVHIDNLEIFFKLRLSKDEQNVPELFRISAQIAKGESIEDFSAQLLTAENVQALSNMLRNKFNGIINQPLRNSLVSESLLFAEQHDITYSLGLRNAFTEFLLNTQADSYSSRTVPILIAKQLLFKATPVNLRDVRSFINFFSHLFATTYDERQEPYILEKCEFLLLTLDYFNKEQVNAIENTLINNYKKERLIDTFLGSEKARKLFISGKFIDEVLKRFTEAKTYEDARPLFRIMMKLGTDHVYNGGLAAKAANCFAFMSVKTQNEGLSELLQTATTIFTRFLSLGDGIPSAVLSPVVEAIKTIPGREAECLTLMKSFLTSSDYNQASQEWFRSFFMKADYATIMELVNSIGVGLYFGEEVHEQLYQRSIELENLPHVLMPLLNANLQEEYIRFLCIHSEFRLLQIVLPTVHELSAEQAVTICNLTIDAIEIDIDNLDISVLAEFTITILDFSAAHLHLIPSNYNELLFKLIQRSPGSDVFNAGAIALQRAINHEMADRDHLAAGVIDVAYSRNYSTDKSLYFLLFDLFNELAREAKNRLGDLLFHHLLLNMGDNITLLETATGVLERAPQFDLKGMENDFHNFLNKATIQMQGTAADYYRTIARLLLKLISKQRSEGFRQIKEQLSFIAKYQHSL